MHFLHFFPSRSVGLWLVKWTRRWHPSSSSRSTRFSRIPCLSRSEASKIFFGLWLMFSSSSLSSHPETDQSNKLQQRAYPPQKLGCVLFPKESRPLDPSLSVLWRVAGSGPELCRIVSETGNKPRMIDMSEDILKEPRRFKIRVLVRLNFFQFLRYITHVPYAKEGGLGVLTRHGSEKEGRCR